MRVLVTGASGYVGSHAVKSLLASGHRPRLLVRDPGRTGRILADIGVDPGDTEMRHGDMLDEDAVGRALDGCDAVIHAAAALGVTGRRADLVTVNVTGTRNVVGGAVARGLDPVIHTSTIAVFVPPASPVITSDSPLARPRTGYGRSKLEAERYARSLQEGGAPVTIVYPGGVLGPSQPHLDAIPAGLAAGLGIAWPVSPGGVSLLDVRDLGDALARCVEPGRGARRLVLGGHYVRWPELADLCDALTGVRCRRIPLPGGLMIALGALLDAAKKVRGFRYPQTRDAAELMVTLVPSDDTVALDALGLTLRPLEESVADTLRWLAAAGHLRPARAGRLRPASKPSSAAGGVRTAPRGDDEGNGPGSAVGRRRGETPRGRAGEERGLDGGPNSRKELVMPVSALQEVLTPVARKLASAPWFARIGPKVVPPLDRVLHRLSGGRVLLPAIVLPSIVLTTTGRKTGLRRETPLICLPEEDGSFVVVGSNFGRDHHPAWTANLLADPKAEVRYQGRRIPVTAQVLKGAERSEVWPRLVRIWSVYDTYVERADQRELRVFRLTPS
jgi:deazaflavin-dependent oxidoreductase (nitroreductase family)